MSQIEAGIAKGYSDKEVVSAVVRAVQPGLQLRSYLENMVELTLPNYDKLRAFISMRKTPPSYINYLQTWPRNLKKIPRLS